MVHRPLLKRILVPSCALLLMLGVLLLPRGEIKPRMKVALSVWPGSEALVLAHDAGLLPPGRVRLIETPWSSAVTRIFDDDVVDVAIMTLDTVLQLRSSGHKLRVLRALDESTGGDALIARAPLNGLDGLKGKRVAVDVQGTGMYLLINALEKAGLTMQDIETVPIIQPEIDDLFKRGKIDAAVTSEPWLTQVSSEEIRIIYDSTLLETPILRLLVASESACLNFKAELPVMMRAITDMTVRVRSHADFEGMASILRRENVSLAGFVKGLERWQPLDAQANAELLNGPTPKLERMAQSMEAQMLRHGLLPARPGVAPWIDPQFLSSAWP